CRSPWSVHRQRLASERAAWPLRAAVGPRWPPFCSAIAAASGTSIRWRSLRTAAMLTPLSVVTWGAVPAEARAALRPDGQWQLRLPGDESSWPAVLATLPAEITGAVLTLGEGEADETLAAFGFVPTRTEQLWQAPVAGLVGVIESPRHTLVSVTGCDLARVAELENSVRAQIPGAQGWVGTVSDLQESLADDEFDPELYLVPCGDRDRHHQPGLALAGGAPWRDLAGPNRRMGAAGRSGPVMAGPAHLREWQGEWTADRTHRRRHSRGARADGGRDQRPVPAPV